VQGEANVLLQPWAKQMQEDFRMQSQCKLFQNTGCLPNKMWTQENNTQKLKVRQTEIETHPEG
jgi:hypothetical protein